MGLDADEKADEKAWGPACAGMTSLVLVPVRPATFDLEHPDFFSGRSSMFRPSRKKDQDGATRACSFD
jgi:hypothetical protein